MEVFNHLVSADFMPHGYCYLWDPWIVWLNVVSDGFITLSYYCIPVVLIYFIRKRRDLPFNWVFWMFGTFILACGTTHLMEVWNIWHASYVFAGIVKAITAGVSVVTAVKLVPLVPKAVSVPNLIHLQEKNRKLEQEIAERTRFDAPIEASLRRRANVGFVVVILLTSLLGFLSWRSQRQAVEDAEWVSHTHEVLTILEATFRHVLEVESAARGLALTGNQSFLESYETGKYAIGENLQALRLLVPDNPGQEQRLDVLAEQVTARIENSDARVVSRQNTGVVPTAAPIERGKQDMDAVRATVDQMETEEGRLLELRTQRTRVTRRVTNLVTTLGSILGVVFLAMAWLSVSRQIGVSVRARAEVIAINADLERRVEQRTAALGESEGRLAGVIQSAMDSIISVDDQQRIVLFNAAAEKMFRCAATEVLGQPLLRLIPQRFHAAHGGHIRKFGETGVTNRAMGTMDALWAIRADGQEFQIEASISQIVTGGKKLFTVILRDVTERMLAQEKLAAQTQELSRQSDELTRSQQAFEAQSLMLQSVLDSMAEGLVAADEQGKFIIWNPAAEKILGLGAANLSSQQWSEHYGLFLDDMVTPFPADQLPLVRAIRGEASAAEMFVRNPELAEGVWIEASAGPLKEQGRRGTWRRGGISRHYSKAHLRARNPKVELRTGVPGRGAYCSAGGSQPGTGVLHLQRGP